tara:strand:- start:5600 stop:6070 length:471 start_codon:yes stop_codon:yes gene_type:complete
LVNNASVRGKKRAKERKKERRVSSIVFAFVARAPKNAPHFLCVFASKRSPSSSKVVQNRSSSFAPLNRLLFFFFFFFFFFFHWTAATPFPDDDGDKRTTPKTIRNPSFFFSRATSSHQFTREEKEGPYTLYKTALNHPTNERTKRTKKTHILSPST